MSWYCRFRRNPRAPHSFRGNALVRGAVKLWRCLGDAGGVATEFAAVAPLMLAFTYGIVEVGHYVYIRVLVENALQEGLRYAEINNTDIANPSATATQVGTDASTDLAGFGITCSSCTASFAGSTTDSNGNPNDSPGNTVTLTTTVTYTPLMPGVTAIPYIGTIFQLNPTISVSGTTTITPGGLS